MSIADLTLQNAHGAKRVPRRHAGQVLADQVIDAGSTAAENQQLQEGQRPVGGTGKDKEDLPGLWRWVIFWGHLQVNEFLPGDTSYVMRMLRCGGWTEDGCKLPTK